jgi:hypothetical protein
LAKLLVEGQVEISPALALFKQSELRNQTGGTLVIYAYPRLSPNDLLLCRVSGLGLGNLLFPWARCAVACRLSGWRMIAPQWWQYDIFALWQRDRSSRCYFGMLNPPGTAIRGLGRLWRLITIPRVHEPTWPELKVEEDGGSKIVDFSGIGSYFEKFLRHREIVRSELQSVVRSPHQGIKNLDFRNSIMVNVRLGDFTPPTTAASAVPQYNRRTSMEWYLGAIGELRRCLGANWPVLIISDGTDEQLVPLLSLKNTRRLDVKDLAAMLTLSRAHVMVASGSTFTMWSSFLGGMPVLWPPGQRRQKLYPLCPEAEPEWQQGTALSSEFLQAVARFSPQQ